MAKGDNRTKIVSKKAKDTSKTVIPNMDIYEIDKLRSILNAKGKRGPKKTQQLFSDNELRLIYKLACSGVSDKEILKCVHLSENIMSSKKKKDIDRYKYLIAVIEFAKVDRLGKLTEVLFKKALQGDNTCLLFALKTQFKDYGWSEKQNDDNKNDNNGSLVDLIRDLTVKKN